MPQIIIDIAVADLPRVIDAIAGQYNYQDTIPDPNNPEGPEIANPETHAQFAKRQAARWAKENVISWEAKQASEAARLIAITDAEGIDIT